MPQSKKVISTPQKLLKKQKVPIAAITKDKRKKFKIKEIKKVQVYWSMEPI